MFGIYRPYMVDGYNFGDAGVASAYKTSGGDSLGGGFIEVTSDADGGEPHCDDGNSEDFVCHAIAGCEWTPAYEGAHGHLGSCNPAGGNDDNDPGSIDTSGSGADSLNCEFIPTFPESL